MNALLSKYNIVEVKQINYGWSGDKKFILIDKNGKKYILRESSIELFDKRNTQYSYASKLTSLNKNVAKPIDKGVLNNKKSFFILYSYLEGEGAESAITKHTANEAYNLGIEAGEILKAIHSIKVSHPKLPWYTRYVEKSQTKISNYQNCELKLPKGDLILDYYKNNLFLMQNRPLVYTHGDYHLGNMVIDNGKLGIIDFDKISISDPYDDFKPYCWNVLKSEHFATGLINGYFNNVIPEDFFTILKFYTAESLISHLPWAFKFGKKEVETSFAVYESVMKWYDNFNLTVPTWYLGIK